MAVERRRCEEPRDEVLECTLPSREGVGVVDRERGEGCGVGSEVVRVGRGGRGREDEVGWGCGDGVSFVSVTMLD